MSNRVKVGCATVTPPGNKTYTAQRPLPREREGCFFRLGALEAFGLGRSRHLPGLGILILVFLENELLQTAAELVIDRVRYVLVRAVLDLPGRHADNKAVITVHDLHIVHHERVVKGHSRECLKPGLVPEMYPHFGDFHHTNPPHMLSAPPYTPAVAYYSRQRYYY